MDSGMCILQCLPSSVRALVFCSELGLSKDARAIGPDNSSRGENLMNGASKKTLAFQLSKQYLQPNIFSFPYPRTLSFQPNPAHAAASA